MISFSYKNPSSKMIILRCIGGQNFFLERVIYPAEIYTFQAPKESKVEIWGLQTLGATLEKRMRVTSAS